MTYSIRFLLGLLTLLVACLLPGCGTTSVERQANTTIEASNIAVDAALQAFYRSYAMQERQNDATRATDPGGYLERNQALLLKHGKVTVAHEKYKAAVKLTVQAWIDSHVLGDSNLSVIPSSEAVLAAQANLLSIAK